MIVDLHAHYPMHVIERRDLGPLPPGFFSAPFGNCYRCPLRCSGCDLACLDLVRSVIREQVEMGVAVRMAVLDTLARVHRPGA